MYLIFSHVNQYDYSKTEYYPLSPQEFCVGAIGDKIIVKAYFYVNPYPANVENMVS
jgi:hypothetical protein